MMLKARMTFNPMNTSKRGGGSVAIFGRERIGTHKLVVEAWMVEVKGDGDEKVY